MGGLNDEDKYLAITLYYMVTQALYQCAIESPVSLKQLYGSHKNIGLNWINENRKSELALHGVIRIDDYDEAGAISFVREFHSCTQISAEIKIPDEVIKGLEHGES